MIIGSRTEPAILIMKIDVSGRLKEKEYQTAKRAEDGTIGVTSIYSAEKRCSIPTPEV